MRQLVLAADVARLVHESAVLQKSPTIADVGLSVRFLGWPDDQAR